MNISPTPRRYNSRSGGMDFNDENYLAFSDPVNRDSNGNGMGRERIIPEEYKLNSRMINRLIRQNKELMNKLDGKQEEIDRLNVLVGSLRGKLIKYTELNKKLEDRQNVSRIPSDGSNDVETDSNYIQLPKRRNNKELDKDTTDPRLSKDDRISALSEKLDMLTKIMMESRNSSLASPSQKEHSTSVPTPSSAPTSTTTATSPPPPNTSTAILHRPSEEDIMCRESMELKQLEDQIESLKRKLLIKRENELRKISLSQELLELMGKLSMEQAQAQQNVPSANTPTAGPSVEQQMVSSSPEYCMECHHTKAHPLHQHHNHNHFHRNDINSRRPTVPAINPLETPTPLAKKSNLAASTGDLTDTINRVW